MKVSSIFVALLALLSAPGLARMFRLPRVEFISMLKASPLGRYVELGACAWYAAFKEDGPQPEEVQGLIAGIGSTILAPTPGGTTPDLMQGIQKLLASAGALDAACKVRSLRLSYVCAGTPLGAYKKPVQPFTRAALSFGVNATLSGLPANYRINLCVDLAASGPVPCGGLTAMG